MLLGHASAQFRTKHRLRGARHRSPATEARLHQATARARASDLRARLDRLGAVRQAYQQDQPASTVDEAVSEALSNPIITKLRTQYLELVNRESDWSVRYGKNHTAVATLRNQMRDMRRSMNDELGRIEETYKSEYEIAKKAQEELEGTLATLISQSQTTNQAQVTLFRACCDQSGLYPQ